MKFKDLKKYFNYVLDLNYRWNRKIPSYVSFALCLYGFTSISFGIFHLMFTTHPVKYIDEIFHVPQARQYCWLNFTHWDPKITTLPGLYLYTASFLYPVSYFFGTDVCNLFLLRLVNVFTSILIFCLLYLTFKLVYKNYLVQHDIVLWSALNVSTFPVLYFFSFLYYSDVVSVLFVLLTHYYHLRRKYFKGAVFGALSVLMRQTNVVWVGFMILEIMNEFFHGICGKVGVKMFTESKYFKIVLNKFFKKKMALIEVVMQAKGYILVCGLFLLFVYINGGIVVGDRSSHTAVIHIPQLFYFSLFCTLFSFPFAFRSVLPFLSFIKRYYLITTIIVILFTIIVHYNSLVHPYLLADNRHYTFYVWKLIEKYKFLRYSLIPIYLFSMYNISYNLSHMKFFFPLIFWVCTAMLVIPQRLLETRYFILPYLFYRLNLRPVYRWHLFFETVFYTSVNTFVISMFVNKEFYWSDSSNVQRIGW